MWTLGLTNKDKAPLWLRASVVPLVREVDNPIALVETPKKLMESVAVDQHADRITALMQVGFRVGDGTEATIQCRQKIPEERHEHSADAGRHFERVWLNQQVGCAKSSEGTHPLLGSLCASQFVRDGTVAVIQERDGNGKKSELHNSVAKGVARKEDEQRNLLPDML